MNRKFFLLIFLTMLGVVLFLIIQPNNSVSKRITKEIKDLGALEVYCKYGVKSPLLEEIKYRGIIYSVFFLLWVV